VAQRLGAFLSHHTKALKGTHKTDCKQGNHPLTSSLCYPPLYYWGKSVASFTLALWSLCPYLSSINNNTRKRKCNRHCFSDKWNFFCDFSPKLVLNMCTFLCHSVLSTDKWDNISNNESTTVWQIVLVLSDTVDSFYRPVKVHSLCSRLYIAAAVAINTTVSSVIYNLYNIYNISTRPTYSGNLNLKPPAPLYPVTGL